MDSLQTIPKDWMEDTRDVDVVIGKAVALQIWTGRQLEFGVGGIRPIANASFKEALDHKVKVEVLTFLCNGLVPSLSIINLEENFLCNIFPELALFVDKVFAEIAEIIQADNVDKIEANDMNKSEILHDLLLVQLSIMECIESCLKYIYETFDSINICQIHSLPQPVLFIVKSTFQHCMKSENAYGEFFQDVSQDLSLIFRKSFELQKVLLELLNAKMEDLTLSNSEKDLENIAAVCHNLLDICDITEYIDSNITPGIWKSLMRLITRNKEKIRNYLQIERIVAQMCGVLEKKIQSYENLFTNKDQEDKSQVCEPQHPKLLKVLKFLIKLLMNFVQSFQDSLILSSCKCILHLIFTIARLRYANLMTQPRSVTEADDVMESLVIVVEPFLKIMVFNQYFADLLTRLDQEIDPENYFSRCYVLANIVVLLPVMSEKMLTYWINPANYPEDEPRMSAFDALLQSSDSCYIEISLPLMLPGTMCNGKAQRMVSFYEYVVSRLIASITAIPSQYFHVLERVLLDSILRTSLTSSLMAADVWCFMARWSTADLCYSHVNLFLQWLSTVSWENDLQKSRIATLVRRLLPLMATEHQELLLKTYSPVSFDNVEIWSLVPLHKMIQPVRQQVSQSVAPLLTSMFHQWMNKNLPEPQLDKALRCIRNLVSHRITLDCLPTDPRSALLFVILKLFDAFLDIHQEISKSHWASLIDILKSILPFMQPCHFIKVLHNLSKIIVLFKDDLLNINVARLMAECGKLAFPIEQNESSSISEIFRRLVTSSSWLAHNEAFLALRCFAEVTPYTPVLEECVPDQLKTDFQKYICAIPYNCSENEDKNILLLRVLKEQATKTQLIKLQKNSTTLDLAAVIEVEKRKREDSDQGKAKRKRTESDSNMTSQDEQVLSSSIDEILKHVFTIHEISSRCAVLPPDVREKLKTVKQSLDALVTST